MHTTLPFSEEVRRDLVHDLQRFIGELATVEFRSMGKRGGGELYKGKIVGVYPNGFLLDGGGIGGRAFFSYSDLFAEHAKMVGGPAASAVRRTVTRLRNELAHLIPSRSVRVETHEALLA
jgi:hypothetical protein